LQLYNYIAPASLFDFCSLQAIRIYVACLTLKVNEDVSLHSHTHELVIDRKTAEEASEQIHVAREQRELSQKGSLPVVIRRTQTKHNQECLHLSVVLNGVRHRLQITVGTLGGGHFSKITFTVINNLGRERELVVDVDTCSSMLETNELQDLFHYVQLRFPTLNLNTTTSMMKVWTCELALRRYDTFLTFENIEEKEKEEKKRKKRK
jgi:hypothetical protein